MSNDGYPDRLLWIIPDGDQHIEALTNAAEWIHANAAAGTHLRDPDGPCMHCWRAAAYALKGVLLAGYQPTLTPAAPTT